MIEFGIYTLEEPINLALVEIFKGHPKAQLKRWSIQTIKSLAEAKKASIADEETLPPGLLEEWAVKGKERAEWIAAGEPATPTPGAFPYADDEVEVTGRTYPQVFTRWGARAGTFKSGLRTVAKIRRKHIEAIQAILTAPKGAKMAIREALVAGVDELQAL